MFQVERDLMVEQYGKALWMMRTLPSHAAHWTAGVFLPPHERLWLSIMFSEYKENNIVASRGTSKSFTHASFGAPLYDALHKNSTTLVVSASGFRGGKLLFEDIDRFFKGQLRSQRPEGQFLQYSVATKTKDKVVTRQPDMWYVDHKSQSRTLTVPTNNPDAMRGIRATTVIVDERNTFDGEIVQKVIRPMLNVGKDFRKAATGIGQNKVFQVSTIDYTFRDWFPEIEAQNRLARREYQAYKARKAQDWEEYDRLMDYADGELQSASFSITKIDYTDLLVPTEVEDEDGVLYDVRVPLPPDIKKPDICIYDKRDKKSYWYLYPVDKKGLEDPWRNGTMDEDLWLAEQRNMFISASGTVYPHELIVKASERPIYASGKVPNYPSYEDDFNAPVMYNCADPCVLGGDYARESDEFALVVIRLGPISTHHFDPFMSERDPEGRVYLGRTTWCNAIWAESHRHMTADNAADLIRNLRGRYNLINVPTMGGGIALDKMGGGTAIRDSLAIPKPPMVGGKPLEGWVPPQKIYDPDDDDYKHYDAFNDPVNYWGGLELINPTNEFNLTSTMASKAWLQKQGLYIGKYEPPAVWAKQYGLLNSSGGPDDKHPLYRAIRVGYLGVSRLNSQLVRLQSKVSETGVIRFIMPGKRELEEGKKDLYSAFIYATYLSRKHVVGMTKDGMNAPPSAKPVLLQVGSDYRRSKGKSHGRRLNWGGRG